MEECTKCVGVGGGLDGGLVVESREERGLFLCLTVVSKKKFPGFHFKSN